MNRHLSLLAAALLTAIAALPAMATDYYIGEKSGALTTDRQGGQVKATYNFGQDGFGAIGRSRGNEVILDRYNEEDRGFDGGPNIKLTFSAGQVKSDLIGKNTQWEGVPVKGKYTQLDYERMKDSLASSNPKLARAQQKMDNAMKALLDATPENSRQTVIRGQRAWMKDIDQTTQGIIMYADIPEQRNVQKRIAQGYTVVLNDRTMQLDELTKQAKDPRYTPTIKGTLSFCLNERGNTCLYPDKHSVGIPLCKPKTAACRSADRLLAGDMEADAKVTGRLDIEKGYLNNRNVRVEKKR